MRGGLAVLEQEQRWDGADAELAGHARILVDVDLHDLHLAGHLGRDFFQRRPDHLAGTAPFSPKIHDHGLGRVQDFGFERGVSDFNGGHGNLGRQAGGYPRLMGNL